MLSTFSGCNIEAGCDEAGRGSLSGPVVAAAVILPIGPPYSLIADSKKLSEKARNEAAEWIKSNALAWSVASVSPEEIDKVNILNASILAMNKAVGMLNIQPEYLLIDGNRFHTTLGIPFTCIIKGDSKIASISAASILAKTSRDQIMIDLHEKHPEFNWKQNKGYPTKEHRNAIIKYGPTPWHRKSFRVRDVEQREILFE